MTTDTSEKGLESLIVTAMTGRAWPELAIADTAAQTIPAFGGTGWLNSRPEDYNREWCVDLVQLVAFLRSTQPKLNAGLDLDSDSPNRRAFLSRLFNEVGKRGVIDVLRHGIKHGQHDIILFYATPSPGNEKAAELHVLNRFSVTRQLRYSSNETMRALDSLPTDLSLHPKHGDSIFSEPENYVKVARLQSPTIQAIDA